MAKNNYQVSATLKFKTDMSTVTQDIERAKKAFEGRPWSIKVDIKGAAELKKLKEDAGGASSALSSLSSQAAKTSQAVSSMNSGLAGSAKQFKDINSAINQSTTGMEKFGHQVRLAAQRFVAFSVATTGIFALMGAIRKAGSEVIEFDRNMNKLIQVSSDSTRDIRALGSEILNMSKNLGVSSKEMIGATLIFAQAGLSINEMKKAMDAVAKTQLAPNFDNIKQTTEGAIAAFQQFGKNADNFGKQLGGMNAVAGAFAVEAGDLVTATQKAGGAFSAMGGNLEELMGLFTSVRATTRESAESISTGLRTIFTRLQRQDTVDAMKELGVNLRYTANEAAALGKVDLEGQFVGAYEAVKRLSSGLNELRETDPRFSNAIEQLGGYRQISRVIPLLKEFGTAQKAVNVAKVGEISLDIAKEQSSKRIEIRLQKITEGYSKLLNEASQTKSFDNMLSTLEKIAGVFEKILANAGPLIPVLGGLALGQGIKSAGNFVSGFNNSGSLPSAPKMVGAVKRFASGGQVGGIGNEDNVPALLMPGEVVVNKKAAQSVGYGFFSQLNAGTLPRYASGTDGPVGETAKQRMERRLAEKKAGISNVIPTTGYSAGLGYEDRLRENARKNARIAAEARAAADAEDLAGAGVFSSATQEPEQKKAASGSIGALLSKRGLSQEQINNMIVSASNMAATRLFRARKSSNVVEAYSHFTQGAQLSGREAIPNIQAEVGGRALEKMNEWKVSEKLSEALPGLKTNEDLIKAVTSTLSAKMIGDFKNISRRKEDRAEGRGSGLISGMTEQIFNNLRNGIVDDSDSSFGARNRGGLQAGSGQDVSAFSQTVTEIKKLTEETLFKNTKGKMSKLFKPALMTSITERIKAQNAGFNELPRDKAASLLLEEMQKEIEKANKPKRPVGAPKKQKPSEIIKGLVGDLKLPEPDTTTAPPAGPSAPQQLLKLGYRPVNKFLEDKRAEEARKMDEFVRRQAMDKRDGRAMLASRSVEDNGFLDPRRNQFPGTPLTTNLPTLGSLNKPSTTLSLLNRLNITRDPKVNSQFRESEYLAQQIASTVKNPFQKEQSAARLLPFYDPKKKPDNIYDGSLPRPSLLNSTGKEFSPKSAPAIQDILINQFAKGDFGGLQPRLGQAANLRTDFQPIVKTAGSGEVKSPAMMNVEKLLEKFSKNLGMDVSKMVSAVNIVDKLKRDDGTYSRGRFNNLTREVKLSSKTASSSMLEEVLAHEVGHAVHRELGGKATKGIYDNLDYKDDWSQIAMGKRVQMAASGNLATGRSDTKPELVANAISDVLRGNSNMQTAATKAILDTHKSNISKATATAIEIPLLTPGTGPVQRRDGAQLLSVGASKPPTTPKPPQNTGLYFDSNSFDNDGKKSRIPLNVITAPTKPKEYYSEQLSGFALSRYNNTPDTVNPRTLGGTSRRGRYNTFEPVNLEPPSTGGPLDIGALLRGSTNKGLVDLANELTLKGLNDKGGPNLFSNATAAQYTRELDKDGNPTGTVSYGTAAGTEMKGLVKELARGVYDTARANGVSRAEAGIIAQEVSKSAVIQNATVTRGANGRLNLDQGGYGSVGYGHLDAGAKRAPSGYGWAGRQYDKAIYGSSKFANGASAVTQWASNNRTGVAIGLSGVASYIGEGIAPGANQIKNLGTSAGNDSGYKGRSVGAGLFQGAAFGASVGIAGGPWGAVAGAIIGGGLGIAKSLSEAADAINEAKLGLAVEGISKEFQAIAQNRKSFQDINGDDFASNVAQIKASANRTAGKVSSNIIGMDGSAKDYVAAYKREIQIGAGSQLFGLYGGVQNEAERFGKSNYKNISGQSVDDIGSQLMNDKKIASSVSLLVDLGVFATTNAAIRELGKEALKAASAEEVRNKVLESNIESDRVQVALSQFADAANAATQSANKFNVKLSSIEASIGQGSGPGLSNMGDVFGSIGANSPEALSNVVGLLNRSGASGVGSGLENIDRLASILPGALSSALANGSMDETLGKTLSDSIKQSLGGGELTADMKRLIAMVQNNLDDIVKKDKGAFENDAKRDTRGAATALLGKELDVTRGEGLRLMTNLMKGQEDYAAGGNVARGLRGGALGYKMSAQQTSLDILRKETEFNNPTKDASRMLTSEQLNSAFMANQGSLLDGVANNPQAIADEINNLSTQIEAAAKKRERTSGTAAFMGDDQNFNNLLSQADRLKQALSNLADASARTATAQEKMAAISNSINSRRSYTERFIMADPAERFKMERDSKFAGQTENKADFLNMSIYNQQRVIGGLRSMGDGKLANGDIASKRLESFLDARGGIGAAAENDELKTAQKEYIEALKTAKTAQEAQAKVLEMANDKFLKGLEQKFNTFLSEFALGIKLGEMNKAQNAVTEATSNFKNAEALSNKKGFLEQYGIKTDTDFNRVRQNLPLLEKLWEAEADTNPKKFKSNNDVLRDIKNIDISNASSVLRDTGGDVIWATQEQKQRRADAISNAAEPILGGQSQEVIAVFKQYIRENSGAGAFSAFTGGKAAKWRADGDDEKLRDSEKEFILTLIRRGLEEAQNKTKDGAIIRYNEAREKLGFSPNGVKNFSVSGVNDFGAVIADMSKADQEKFKKFMGDFKDGAQYRDATENVKKFDEALKQATKALNAIAATIPKSRGGTMEEGSAAPKPESSKTFSDRFFGAQASARGTDTVPAMLSPGELVIPANEVQYLADGGIVKGLGGGAIPGMAAFDRRKGRTLAYNMRQRLAAERRDYQAASLYNLAFQGDEGPSNLVDGIRRRGGFRNEALGRSAQLSEYYGDMKDRAIAQKRPFRFASGGMVPGSGFGDKVHAMLEPGEIVMSRQGVTNAGAGNLARANAGGGLGGSGDSDKLAAAMTEFNNKSGPLSSSLSTFSTSVDRFVAAVEKIPQSVEMKGRVDHNHVFNGIEMFKDIIPAFKKMAEQITNSIIDERVSTAAPPPLSSGVG